MENELNIYQKIQNVANDIMNLEKDMQVGKGTYGYKAVSDQQVILAVKEAEKKHGLVSIPVKQKILESKEVKIEKTNGKEGINYVDRIKMTIRIVNIEKPEEFIEVESHGLGLDSGDKGLGKASTYARKYGLLNAYKIATGEDPDKNASKEDNSVSVDDMKVKVFNYLAKDNEYCQNVLTHFNVGEIGDLSKSNIKQVYESLLQKNKIQ